MTKYETLMNKSEECLEKAKSITDVDLKVFYKNASDGYKMKAMNLSVTEASMEE